MTPERWQQVKNLFQAALERAPEERERFLDEECAADSALRAEVDQMLAADSRDDSFLKAPALGGTLAQLADGAADEERASLVGDWLGPYSIIKLIGIGGMGEVYLAEDTRLGRRVALKLLPVEFSKDVERVRRFAREARAASALNHPHIITVHEIAHVDGRHFIVTEYAEGETLRERIKRGRLEVKEAVEIVTQIASALAKAHAAGIIHRDIKPENIMLHPDGYAKTLDFGLAKLIERQNATPGAEDPTNLRYDTNPGVVMGTINYMSPEQLRGQDVDARTDLWSLGVVFYEMLCAGLPFQGATPNDAIAAILKSEPSLDVIDGVAADETRRIIGKALQKECAERYESAAAMLLDVKSLKQELEFASHLKRSAAPNAPDSARNDRTLAEQATEEIVAARTEGSRARSVNTFSRIRHPRIAFAAIFALAVIVAVGVYFFRFAHGGQPVAQSIAVLPFVNTDGDPEAEYLSDGISESLIDRLAQLPQLKVIARSSSFKFKGKNTDVQEVAKTLGVQTVLTGRVARRGAHLLISAELVDARDGSLMWGGQYDRQAEDLQTVQTEISQEIARRLQLRLTPDETRRVIEHPSVNPAAYDLLLKSRFSSYKATKEGRLRAIEYLNQALQIEPNYALALADLAIIYRGLAFNTQLDQSEAMPKARAAAQKALELDEQLADVHYALGGIKQNDLDWAGAESEFKRAIELDPNLARAHTGYATLLSLLGRHDAAIAESKRGRELDPLSLIANVNLAARYFRARRYDEAIKTAQQTLELDNNYSFPHIYIGYSYAMKGDYPQAIAAYKEALKADPEDTSTPCFLGYAYAKAGQRQEAEAILKQLLTTKDYVSPVELANLYLGLGDREKALELIEEGYARRDLQLQYLGSDPLYDELRSEPRFQDILRRIGLKS